MTDRPPPRRPGFDDLVQGWGSDNMADLNARMQLALEFQEKNGNLSLAEDKVYRAMAARYAGFKIARGDYDLK